MPTTRSSDPSPRIAFLRRMAVHDAGLRLYAILDAESCSRRGLDLLDVARAWRAAGVQLVQYRDKLGSAESVVHFAVELRKIFPPGEAFLLLNDMPGLVATCRFDGAHVGQEDAHPNRARELLGPDGILGVSTHSADQALAACSTEADYLAIGPIFATATKANAAPPVGLCGLQAARATTTKPLVAIGGIALGDARAVEMAGADAIAVISALLTDHPETTACEFLSRLR